MHFESDIFGRVMRGKEVIETRFRTLRRAAFVLPSILILSACATPAPVARVSAPAALATHDIAPPLSEHVLKRKIAIGRFTNDTLYGKALLLPGQRDPLGAQAAAMMATALVRTHRFIVLERRNIGMVQAEQALDHRRGDIAGADVLLVGAVTEFGRQTEGEDGFLSNTKKQVANAKVAIRLVDARTARVIFTASGTGKASIENGTIAGFGNRAGYDETLNDRAIGAAIDDVTNEVVERLDQLPWRTDILKRSGGAVYIAGGVHQGLRPGTRLAVMQRTGRVRSAQTGFAISLPPLQVATVTVVSNFGTGAENEGSICTVTSGSISAKYTDLFVVQDGNP